MMKKGFLVPVSLCVSLNCQAYETIFEPAFNSNERYETNLNMRQVPLQDNWITTLSPSVNLGLRNETGELSSRLAWNELLYNNQSSLDRAEQLFSSNYQQKFERLSWGLGSSYNNQSSINTEATTTGILLTQVMSKQLSLAPTLSYALDELNSVSLNYAYNKATYEQGQNNVYLRDYTNQQASTSFNHVYSERDTFSATLSGTLYETKFQTTHNYVGQLGWQHKFSEQLSASLSGGMNYSQAESSFQVAQLPFVGFDQQGNPVYIDSTIISDTNPFGLTPQQSYQTVTTKKNNFGKVFSLAIQKSFERGSVSLSASQNQSPTAVGLQTQQQLSISTSYAIDERWNSGLSASYGKSEITGQSNSGFNRTNYSLSPNINWKYSPEINLGFSYTYRQQEFQSSTQASVGNTVQLQFSYQPQINLR